MGDHRDIIFLVSSKPIPWPSILYLMMQRLTFPFPFVHHQTHDWLLSVLEWHLCSSRGLGKRFDDGATFPGFTAIKCQKKNRREKGWKSVVWKCIQLVNVWKVEQLLTVETRTLPC